uniref:Fibronectin type-III domain-containing protein n=1 Tax=Schistocephalus solidus TaxID=70667 RepID=A0A183TTM3_SCHSO
LQIVALCAGPGAVIFGVSNPPVSPENEPTDKIVSQRVLFAPSSEFHSASNLASKSIILDVEGQPRSETVDADEEAVQEALEKSPAQRKMSATDPPLVTVPITNLLPGTNYTFEWSSANQFSLTTTSQFTTSTAPLAPPLKPTVRVVDMLCCASFNSYFTSHLIRFLDQVTTSPSKEACFKLKALG